MPNIRIDFNDVLAERVGKHGIKTEWLKKIEPKAKEAIKSIQKNRGKDMTAWLNLPQEKEQVKKILASARRKRGKYEDIVVLGIGGSALGTIAMRAALLHPYHNMLDRQMRKGQPRLHVMDNIDPLAMEHLFEDVIDIHKTLFIVISKSGATAETMSQFMLAFELVESCLGERNIKKHLIAITDAEKGFLRPLAEDLGLESYIINDGVGGRFSVLSPVGLLPAALCGMDVRALLTGAAQMDARCKTASLYKNPAAMYAAVHYLADTKLKAPLSVMMPYASGLKDFADWYCQLWAESLGKARNRKGKIVNVGPTPIKAVGVTDQHSQVQLYTEGPFDKVVTFIGVEKFRLKLPIPGVFKEVEGIGYLGGQSFNKLIEAERRATQLALSNAGRMNLSIILPKIDANSLGQLFFLFEAATAIMGEFYDINAYNQPGVEAGKVATYALMGRKGFEKEAKKIATRKPADKKYIL